MTLNFPNRPSRRAAVLSATALAALLAGCSKDGLKVAADVALDGQVPISVALDTPSGQPIGLNVTGEVPVNVALGGPSGQPIGFNVTGEVPVNVSLDGGGKPFGLNLGGELPVNVKLEMPDGGGATGTYVSAEMLNTVKVNETRAEVVAAILGRPDRVSDLSDGSSIWVWDYGPAIPLVQVNIFSGKAPDEPTGTHVKCYVQIRDGVAVALGRG